MSQTEGLGAEPQSPVALDIGELINVLVAEEMSLLQIPNPNQGPPYVIDIRGPWTGGKDRRFVGESLIECLRSAVMAKYGGCIIPVYGRPNRKMT